MQSVQSVQGQTLAPVNPSEESEEELFRYITMSALLINPFIDDFPTGTGYSSILGQITQGAHKLIQELIEKIASLPNDEFPVAHFISHWEKGPTWFNTLMRLHFRGHSVDDLTHEVLGLEGEGEYEQHKVYRAVLDKLKECHGIKNFDDFKHFMDWLVRLDFVKELPSEKVIQQVPGWLKSMRANLVHLASPGDASERKPFDPCKDGSPGVDELRAYCARHSRLKCQILRSLLGSAPQDWCFRIINSWLHDQDQSSAREVIFKQDAYPLNTHFYYYTLWVVLLDNIVERLPERKPNPLADAFRSVSYPEISNLESAEEIQQKVKGILGRTIVFLPEQGCNRYLKIQAKSETDDKFKLTTARVHWLGSQADNVYDLKSDQVQVRRIVKIMDPEALLDKLLSGEGKEKEKEKEKVLILTGKSARLAADFTLPEGVHYEKYIYDLASDDEKIRALDRFLYDYAGLWKKGISGPGCTNAFHDVKESRPHRTFPSLMSLTDIFEGSLERWNGAATDYPNVGDSGMRDAWDARLEKEHSWEGSCRNRTTLMEEEADLTRRKLSVLGLANAIKGAVLVYGRCFNKSFDFQDQACLQKVKEDIAGRMVVFFCQAFPISQDLCRRLMQEHGLIDQVVREICYWMAHHECKNFYVQDLREGKINRDVYPHLPPEMQGCILSEDNKKFLTDIGFHDPQRDRPGECQLGSGSGRTPLIALNAMLAKLLTAGICGEISERQRVDQESQAELQRSHAVMV